MLHDSLTVLVSLLCLGAVISPNLPTGIVGSLGLGLLAFAALYSMDDFTDPILVIDMLLVGLLLLGLRVAWRLLTARADRQLRRLSDWGDCDSVRDIDAIERRHVAGGRK